MPNTSAMMKTNHPTPLTLVLGGTGKTGRRIVERLTARGWPVRVGSRNVAPAFDWLDQRGWKAALHGVNAVYISYAPDLAVPGATEAVRTFVDTARAAGVERLVLLSGRGEAEAQASEAIVQESGLTWTIIRASWFNQNFSEGEFLSMVQAGEITLPAGDVGEPFVDADDIADVAAAALTEEGHAGAVYEVTGPRLLTFHDVASELAAASGRPVRFTRIPRDAFAEAVAGSGAPDDIAWLLDYLFSTVLDGRNAKVCDGVQRALGRPPTDFSTFARRVATTGLWNAAA